ncbi:phosphoribosylanthranilate isomerase [Cuniculiplasma sp. SKW4]|uniref:phosphoribosylanthranilate isomerase n=1 Tax=Cuniculiplasma sp. SKW4 TaxID=3400171 RepID=UPI003FD2426F
MLIKVCGITNVPDALYSHESGSDLIGVILSDKSPRRGTVDLVNELAGFGLQVVAVYTSIEEALKNQGEEKYAQLHFRTSIQDVERIKDTGRRVISVVNLDDPDFIDYFKYIKQKSDMILLEKRSGIKELIPNISDLLQKNVGIAGKIGPSNIDEIVKLNADFIDLSSSLEKYPGKKDVRLIDDFFRRLRNHELIN